MVTARKLVEPSTKKQRPKRDKRYQYTIEERTRAITVIKTLGGTLSENALNEVDRILGRHVNKTTVWQWMKQTGDLVISEPVQPDYTPLIQDTRNHVIARMQSSLVKIVDRSNNDTIIEAASLKELMLSAAIAIDKLKQFAGISPELEHEVSLLQQACLRTGDDPVSLIHDLRNQVEATPHDSSSASGEGDIVVDAR